MGRRVVTAVVAAATIIYALNAPWAWVMPLISLIGFGFGFYELGKLLNWGLKTNISAAGATLFLILTLGYVRMSLDVIFLILLALFGLGSCSLFLRKVDRPHPLAWMGVFWLAAPVIGFTALHLYRPATPNPVTMLFLCLWAADTFALLAGKAFGKHKMAPTLSPSKTWEGAVGGLLGAIGFGVGTADLFDMPIWVAVIVGVVTGILGPVGDLFESYMKRRVDVKDSGGVFPGHGGMLDRIDSLLMASIPTCWLMYALHPSVFHVKQFFEALFR